MTGLAFPKPTPRREAKRIDTLAKKQDLSKFHFQVLAADGYRCMAREVGCKCKGRLVAHHIDYRSHCGADVPENGISLCDLSAHYAVHNGIKIGGVLLTGRAYMLQILRKHQGKPYFRWHEAIEELQKRY